MRVLRRCAVAGARGTHQRSSHGGIEHPWRQGAARCVAASNAAMHGRATPPILLELVSVLMAPGYLEETCVAGRTPRVGRRRRGWRRANYCLQEALALRASRWATPRVRSGPPPSTPPVAKGSYSERVAPLAVAHAPPFLVGVDGSAHFAAFVDHVVQCDVAPHDVQEAVHTRRLLRLQGDVNVD